ncbi:rRNA accumulation- protein [Fusarium oxysporum]|nr:rRNA accumulation- protein [Fusarium oxysporum]
MASTESAQMPPAAERQSEFEQAVAYALHLWPALTLSVQNGWGGPDSADKRDWFAGAVADLFPEYTDTPPKNGKVPEDPDLEEVETVLLQIMVDEFEVNVDDDSGTEVAGNILRARASCTLGTFDEVKALRTRWLNRKGTKVEGIFKKAEDADQDTDWESDEDDSEDDEGGADVEMDEAPLWLRFLRRSPSLRSTRMASRWSPRRRNKRNKDIKTKWGSNGTSKTSFWH